MNENKLSYRYALYTQDYKTIDKLNNLDNKDTFWDDVRKLTKRITSDRSIKRWQCLSELRYEQL